MALMVVFWLASPGQDYPLDVGIMFVHIAQEIGSRHLRHVLIRNDDIDRPLVEDGAGLLGAGSRQHLQVRLVGEHQLDRSEDQCIVIH